MAKLSDIQIKSWISKDEAEVTAPGWFLAIEKALPFLFGGIDTNSRENNAIMNIGTYGQISLADARKMIKELNAQVALGHNVAAEKQERKAEAVAKIEAKKNALTVEQLVPLCQIISPIQINGFLVK